MKNKLILMSGILAFLINFVSAHVENFNSSSFSHGMMDGFYGMWGTSFFGGTFMILIIVALVLLIIWLVKQIQGPKKGVRKK
ncbi:hypothetical protein GW931_03025 [archaeon]|nr:hypothetical protein [archaeon]PJC45340.1 MAG: hypothetical protein CO037_01975 [Candidatus Pacearchaeota archaeon CG_4_9_14_0_2_um_filter_30_8]